MAMRCPVYKQRDFHLGFDTELENLIGGGKGKGPSGSPARPKVPIRRSGTDCLVLALERVTPVERRGQAIRVMIDLVNWQQEEPTGYGGGRQLSLDGTSRVTGDSHARICERLGVRLPGATRPRGETPRGYSTVRQVPRRNPDLWKRWCRRKPRGSSGVQSLSGAGAIQRPSGLASRRGHRISDRGRAARRER